MPTSPRWSGGSALSAGDPDLLIVDASALVELVIDGRHRRGADVILDRYMASPAVTLLTAAHGLVEALSALRRLARLGQLSDDAAAAAVTWLGDLDLVLDATTPRARRIWELRDTMSAYDAAYAAAGEAFDVPLITVDGRLRRACEKAGIAATGLDDLAGS